MDETLSSETSKPLFRLHSRYLKDASFENFSAPRIDLREPNISVDVQVGGQQSDNLFEIVTDITVTATLARNVQFVAEVSYAGLVEVSHASVDDAVWFIYVETPALLFVHAQRVIADLARDGGFPALSLATPNFEQIWKLKARQMTNVTMEIPKEFYIF